MGGSSNAIATFQVTYGLDAMLSKADFPMGGTSPGISVQFQAAKKETPINRVSSRYYDDLAAFFLLHFLADSRQEDREFIIAVQVQQFVDHVLVVDAQCASTGID